MAADSRGWRTVRAVLGVLAVGALVVLLLLDNTRQDAAPLAVPEDPTPDQTVSSPTVLPTPVPTPEDPGEPDEAVPTPPPGLDALVCAQFTQPHRLRLLSFNTRRSEGPTGALETIAAEIRAVQPDVVLLQEVDRFNPRSGGTDQSQALADLVGMSGSFSANLVRGQSEYGTLILSRHEIVQEGRIPLPGRPGAEPRALQWVTLDVEGQAVNVYNTHLEAVRPRVRLRQARHVVDVVRRDTQPAIMGGDLNSWPGSGVVSALSGHLTDTWSVGQGRSDTGAGGRKIDYLFVGPHFRPLRSQVTPSVISDHHLLWADVRLKVPRRCDV